MAPRRHFLPWDRPLLPQVVDRLAGDWRGSPRLDLSDVWVVVPTKQAGRRLREALAAHAAARNAAVFPPRVLEPKRLILEGPAPANVASRLESQLAWIEVFRDLALEEFRAVFPVDPPAQGLAWARRLAREFGKLQADLAEAGLTLADVGRKAGADFPEAERWQQLARLEQRQAEVLAKLGKVDVQAGLLQRAADALPPAGIRRIVLVGTPDPLPLALTVLERWAALVPVEAVVFAPEEMAADFDVWGRPLTARWEMRHLDLPEFERRVHLCADPAAQAERVVGIARHYAEPEGWLAVGTPEPDLLAPLENALGHAGFATFNPEGRVRRGDGLYQLLEALATLARDDAWSAVEALARCPDMLDFLGDRLGGSFSAARFLAQLDQLRTNHLPPDLREARRHAGDSRELAAIAELREELSTALFPSGAAQVLAKLFAGRRLNLSVPADAAAAESAQAWTEVMREIADVAPRFPTVTAAEWWELALGLYGETTRTEEKPPGAVELQGWLELLWEDAPHLVVPGFNDGSVPTAIVGHPFLPESLRERLGLGSNGARLARDAYLLQALAQCRAADGRLDVLLGKTTAEGDPLRPSRLLFRCPDDTLAARVALLFRGAESAQTNPSWQRAWQLTPLRKPAKNQLAVTALRAWLECPFRFYLRHVLRLRTVDPEKSELDALDFGQLCHAALEAFGRDPQVRESQDAGAIRDFLVAALERKAHEQLGHDLTLPLLIQLESARQRLARAAEVQAEIRRDGWVIVEVERRIELVVGDVTITGKVDRIERHEATGAVRVLDYKTSDQPSRPEDAHLATRPPRPDAPEFSRLTDAADKAKAWIDLQLPLYQRALAADYPGPMELGYFNLPKAATETGLSLWPDYSPALAEAAWLCVTGVVAAIQGGTFWPPNEEIRPDYDDLAALFHHGVAESVAWKEVSA